MLAFENSKVPIEVETDTYITADNILLIVVEGIRIYI